MSRSLGDNVKVFGDNVKVFGGDVKVFGGYFASPQLTISSQMEEGEC